MWHARWTPGKVLFCFIRYLPLIDLPMAVYSTSNTALHSIEMGMLTLRSAVLASSSEYSSCSVTVRWYTCRLPLPVVKVRWAYTPFVVSAFLAALTAEAVVSLRTWAIWDHPRSLAVFLIVSGLSMWAVSFYYIVIALISHGELIMLQEERDRG